MVIVYVRPINKGRRVMDVLVDLVILDTVVI